MQIPKKMGEWGIHPQQILTHPTKKMLPRPKIFRPKLGGVVNLLSRFLSRDCDIIKLFLKNKSEYVNFNQNPKIG